MAIVDLVQRTEAWFDWRKEGITASMIPVIMGLSAYQTPYQLWAEFVGLKEPDDLSGNYHVQRGVEQEPEAREAVENEYGRPYLPVCVEADHNPLFKASLDGLYQLGEDSEVLEIKCPCDKIYNEILELKGSAPTFQMYAAQVQWQLNCSGATRGRLYFYLRGKRPISTGIQRNDTFIKKAEEMALQFWQLVKTKTPPPLDPERDTVVYELEQAPNDWASSVETYKAKAALVSERETELKAMKAEMKELEKYFTSQIPDDVQTFDKDGIRATRVERKGTVDYKKVLSEVEQQLNIVIDDSLIANNTKPSSTYFRITVTDGDSSDETAAKDDSEQPKQVITARDPQAVLDDANVSVEPTKTKAPQEAAPPKEEATVRSPKSFFDKATENMFF
ncbi:lambda-exonuclease family protein [Photobacterium leiognathi]|uniref:lambda-exonuclease family protein n=1 Tax=Photobacterium leiognathi TaxID=553611 RepID=UPI0029818748|nr:YqaJ viral recombinase family protein [Photobacterium leiognathi]